MNQPIYTEQHKGFTIEIQQDQDCESPQEWGDDGLFLVAKHRQFQVNPPNDKKNYNFDPQDVIDEYKKTHHVFGLEAYIHSGVVLALSREGNFPDRQWDVSQLGVVFISKKEARTAKKARTLALGLIETWNDCLSGNVYGFIVNDGSGEMVESVWGFYGDYDKEGGALTEARAIADSEYQKRKEKHERTIKAQIKADVPLERRIAFVI